MSCKKKYDVCTLVTNYFCELRSNEGSKHRNNTQVSAENVRHSSTYIILYVFGAFQVLWIHVRENVIRKKNLYWNQKRWKILDPDYCGS